MSNSFRRQPTRRLTGGLFVRKSSADAAKLIADGFWEAPSAQQEPGIADAAAAITASGGAAGRAGSVSGAVAAASGTGTSSGRGSVIAGATLAASGAGALAGRVTSVVAARATTTGAGGLSGAASVTASADSAFSAQGAGAASGRSAAVTASAGTIQGAASVSGRGGVIVSAALGAAGTATADFTGESESGEGSSGGETEREPEQQAYPAMACVGACGGQAPIAVKRSRKRNDPKVIQVIKVGYWPSEADLRIKPVDTSSIFCITCEDD
jgi:hypothetical protein